MQINALPANAIAAKKTVKSFVKIANKLFNLPSHNASTQFWILFDIDMNVMLPSNTYNSIVIMIIFLLPTSFFTLKFVCGILSTGI